MENLDYHVSNVLNHTFELMLCILRRLNKTKMVLIIFLSVYALEVDDDIL